MKVFVAVYAVTEKPRIEAAIAPVSAAFAARSPGAVRKTSVAFVAAVRGLASAVGVLTEDEWESTLAKVRRDTRGFRADYVLAASEIAALRRTIGDLPPTLRTLVSSVRDDFGVAWLPLDEEVLDGTGL